MAKPKTLHVCSNCQHTTAKWQGQCSNCGEWGTLEESRVETRKGGVIASKAQIQEYGKIETATHARYTSGFNEFDRVLGGGFVPGSLLLLGGDPGIGKSTLMLQVAANLQDSGKQVLYVSGEESGSQIKMRGERLGVKASSLKLLTETAFESLSDVLERNRFDTVFIDSIQTMYCNDLPSGPGSVSQVREITNRLLFLAKTRNITVVIIGHITKEGSLAGPKTLEHMVDGVFYFEGDKYHRLRLVRSQKNRFGPAQELGIFQMEESGLIEVPNPSKILLDQRPKACAGSIVVPCLEGSRPLMVEVQVLLSNSTYSSPRRVAMGVDSNRLALIMAVLERNAGCQLQGLDVFVNVVGGINIQEPAIDLGLALAVYSSFRNLAFAPEIAVFGELGLAGEIRAVSQGDTRLKECKNLGFNKVICPKGNNSHIPDGLAVANVDSLVAALEEAL